MENAANMALWPSDVGREYPDKRMLGKSIDLCKLLITRQQPPLWWKLGRCFVIVKHCFGRQCTVVILRHEIKAYRRKNSIIRQTTIIKHRSGMLESSLSNCHWQTAPLSLLNQYHAADKDTKKKKRVSRCVQNKDYEWNLSCIWQKLTGTTSPLTWNLSPIHQHTQSHEIRIKQQTLKAILNINSKTRKRKRGKSSEEQVDGKKIWATGAGSSSEGLRIFYIWPLHSHCCVH